jgi:hypothetical protein
VPFYWPHIEPKPPSEPAEPVPGVPSLPEDHSRWGGTDEIVGRAARAGVRVLPFVYGTPTWLASDPERPPIDDPAARAAWQDILGDLVRRYGPGGEFWRGTPLDPAPAELPIIEWQIWNEANSPVFWSPKPSPPEYARLVALAGEAIHAADPSATVVLGGMFGAPTSGIPAEKFLSKFHASGRATGSFDAYAMHPYAPNLRGITSQVRGMTRSIEAGPQPDAPLWITEIGWPTDGPPEFDLVKSKPGQKRMLARSFRLLLDHQAGWRIGKVVWYVWRDNDVQAECTVCRYSGLFTKRFEAKPAWRKLTQFAGGTP